MYMYVKNEFAKLLLTKHIAAGTPKKSKHFQHLPRAYHQRRLRRQPVNLPTKT
jgi:hypothetical protein